MRKLISVAAAGIVSVMLAAPAAALNNGTPVSDDDANASAVVQISACTGTVIDPHWVLTAQHCVEVTDLSRNVYVGNTRGEGQRQTFKSDYAVWAPYGDVALAHVPDALPVTNVAKVRSQPVEFGNTGQVYGWGAGTQGKLQSAEGAIGKQLTGIRPAENKKGAFGVYFKGEARAGRGDSGGPIFVDGQVAGVTSYTQKHRQGSAAAFAALNDHVSWINQTIESKKAEHAPQIDAQPEPGIESLSQIGAAAAGNPSFENKETSATTAEPAEKPVSDKISDPRYAELLAFLVRMSKIL